MLTTRRVSGEQAIWRAGVPEKIHLPALHIRGRKILLSTMDAALAAIWPLAGYAIWHAWLRSGSAEPRGLSWEWAVGFPLVWLAASWLAGAYEMDVADHSVRAARVTLGVAVSSAFVSMAAYFAFIKTYPRPALALLWPATALSVLLWRRVYRHAFAHTESQATLLVVGNGRCCDVLRRIANHGYYRIAGFVSWSPDSSLGCLGTVDDIGDIVGALGIHTVVVDAEAALPPAAVNALCRCVERGIRVIPYSEAYEELAARVPLANMDTYWLAALPTSPRIPVAQGAGIRLLDVMGALIGLTVTGIMFPIIAVAILLESGSPILYHQTRVGRAGVPFRIYKFRSMRRDAELDGPQYAMTFDPRATRVGQILRRTHLDELPQFWNVLRGDMSLVGPRPERPMFADELAAAIPYYRLRFSVRPGLTGLKQIRVGYAATLEEHREVLSHDLYYIRHRSLALNLVILARTISTVLAGEGR